MNTDDRDSLEDPRRWRATPADRGGPEAELGAAVRALAEPKVPDDLRLAQIRQEIERRQPRVGMHLGARSAALPWAALVAAMLLGSGVTAVAGWALVLRARPAPAAAPVVAGVATPVKARPRSARRWRIRAGAPALLDFSVDDDGATIAVAQGQAEVHAEELKAPLRLASGDVWRENESPGGSPLAAEGHGVAAPAPAAIEPPPQPRVPLGARPVRAAPRTPPTTVAIGDPATPPSLGPAIAPPPLAPATEGAVVAEALRALRSGGDARGALAALDRCDRQFPAGTLRREATLARAEALLALRRPTEALAALDPLELQAGLADRRATLLRGELRAGASRCAQAETDFTLVLAAGADDESAARALYGRGACRLARGDTPGARADFQAYTTRFPSGEQRTQVARALDGLGE